MFGCNRPPLFHARFASCLTAEQIIAILSKDGSSFDKESLHEKTAIHQADDGS